MNEVRFKTIYHGFTSKIMFVIPTNDATENRIFYRFGHLSEDQIRACMLEFRAAVSVGRLNIGMEPTAAKWAYVVAKLRLPAVNPDKNWYCERMGYTLPTDEEKAEVTRKAGNIARLLGYGTDNQIKQAQQIAERDRLSSASYL